MSAGRPSREVAHRLFAVEFDDATVSLTESDDEMAPSYVVTPTGALVNRAFVVGTLTSVEQVGDDIYRGRVADPTETFVTYAGQYQPAAANFLAESSPPTIVALTGKARTFTPDGSDEVLSSLRPERIIETTPATRDHWVVETARHTLGRIELLARVRAAGIGPAAVGDALDDVPSHVATGIRRAIEHYDPSPAYLTAVHERAVEALEVVAGEREAVDPLMLATDAAEGEATYDDLADAGFVAEWLGHDVAVEAPPSTTPDPEPPTEEEPTETAAEQATEPAEPTPPSAAVTEGGTDIEAPAETDEAVESADVEAETTDSEDLYELSEAEREAVEEEYDVGFESGSEVDAPDTEEPAPDQADDPAEPTPESEPAVEADPVEDGDEGDDEAVDLESAVLKHMRELDTGDGADRAAVIDAVADDTGVAVDAVEDAVQDALMSGTCYEPTEGRLKPI